MRFWATFDVQGKISAWEFRGTGNKANQWPRLRVTKGQTLEVEFAIAPEYARGVRVFAVVELDDHKTVQTVELAQSPVLS